MNRYDKKFQKYLLGEALKGNTAVMDSRDYKKDEACWLSDGTVIKAIHKDETFLHLTRYNLTPIIYSAYTVVDVPEPYQYCQVKGIKNICLKVNDSLFIDSKYLGFFDMKKSILYNTQKGIILVTEDDRVTGAILGIKGEEDISDSIVSKCGDKNKIIK